MEDFMNTDVDRGMGFIRIEDPRDDDYLFSSLPVPMATPTQKYWWADGWWGDQGRTPHCVAFSFTHWVNDGPRLHSLFRNRRPAIDTTELYCEAQKRDPWPGDCDNPLYDGTSVRAGAKVLQEWGFIDSYYWARNTNEIAQAVATRGPVIMGTTWYTGMNRPDSDGFIKPTGTRVGGHAYVINGVNFTKKVFRLKNSWGRWWGKKGHAYLTFEDMADLLVPWGEACVALQKPAK